jgi:phosphate transport system protein
MSQHLQRDIQHLQKDLISLAGSVEEAIMKAIRSLCERQSEPAREVIEGDKSIDLEENHIEEECLKLLALHQPLAIDLRCITSVLKINAELERMGDLAEDIAERSLHLLTLAPIPMPAKLQRMTDMTITMVRRSIDAFVNLDPRQARGVCRDDDQVDELNHEIIEEWIDLMKKNPAMVEPGLSLFSATRHLERIADHATNIAEDVIYIVEGEIVRHRFAPD